MKDAAVLKIKDKTQSIDTIKIEPFKKSVRKTAPHKHNKYLEFVYFTNATGYHAIDNLKITIKPPIFFVVRKEQVHFWDITTEPEGFVIIIKKEFIDDCADFELHQLLLKISAFTHFTPKDNTSIITIFELLSTEYKSKTKSRSIIEGLLKALLGKLLQFNTNDQQLNNSVYHKFTDLLANENKLSNSVEYYAELLNTSPQNLNTSCRNECGKSASEVISDYILSEAKRLLLYTDKTITEIAYTLSFKDNSHFTKYFKRHIGFTPSAYKLQH
ncbi:helix-turn-helix domain-containing protein [Seonamhaeicola algicola]|uniref:Helix-turn-helix domain-containing protein n=1 Tax=Seonamhaeicola algicola TaxID=1719036 RepID=A0A5C7AQ08_9FLAO|nr:helix-turn-helix domain-containing protein [Seonamhaeicola algicola]TXE09683.1 helix-turn-helix domain-containing protein [Seonamhaeicola algicola]